MRYPRRVMHAKGKGIAGFERHDEPLLPRKLFARRMAHNALVAAAIIVGSLAIGAAGYHFFAGLRWVDCILNASMILTGMGPVDPMRSDAAKLFASGYAIYSGVAFLTTVGVLFAPLAHRFLHRFHLEFEEQEQRSRKRAGKTEDA